MMQDNAMVENNSVGKYIPELDGFRAIPLFFVLWGHFGTQYSHFWEPVQGFFVLSGFLISRILLKEKARNQGFKSYFKTYWWRRVLRIFPVYYLYLFLLIGLFLLFGFAPDLPKLIISLLTYTFNIYAPHADIDAMHSTAFEVTQHLWTMSVEEQFYLFLPLIIWFASEKWLRFWTVFFIFGAIAFRYFIGEYYMETLPFPTATSGHVRLNTFSHFDAFFMGVAINIFNLARIRTNWWFWTFLVFTVFLGAGALNVISHFGQFQVKDFAAHLGFHITWYKNYEFVWSYSLVNFSFMLCVLALITQASRKKSLWGSLLKFPPLVLFGKLSYGIYTYHILILGLFSTYAFPARSPIFWVNFLWFLVYVAAVFFVSWLSFELFEKYFLKKKPAYANGENAARSN
jgi:peptidoglycan/LPS O-acetylase OafA/YrhL